MLLVQEFAFGNVHVTIDYKEKDCPHVYDMLNISVATFDTAISLQPPQQW